MLSPMVVMIGISVILLAVIATYTLTSLKIGKLMSTFNDLVTDIQAVSDGVAALAKEIANLKAAGPGAVTQAQLDSIDATVKSLADATKAAQ